MWSGCSIAKVSQAALLLNRHLQQALHAAFGKLEAD
jgi:hypothetical protein